MAQRYHHSTSTLESLGCARMDDNDEHRKDRMSYTSLVELEKQRESLGRVHWDPRQDEARGRGLLLLIWDTPDRDQDGHKLTNY